MGHYGTVQEHPLPGLEVGRCQASFVDGEKIDLRLEGGVMVIQLGKARNDGAGRGNRGAKGTVRRGTGNYKYICMPESRLGEIEARKEFGAG